jgi:hypothetical protein
MSGHSTAPPSSSSGFDLASRASDFGDFDDYNFDAGFDDGGNVDWGQIQAAATLMQAIIFLGRQVSISMSF